MSPDVLAAPSSDSLPLDGVFHRAPLLAVEERVRQRSTDERLDLSTPGARQRLLALIAEESASWHVLFERGIVGFDIADV
jgi:hypothetical protein